MNYFVILSLLFYTFNRIKAISFNERCRNLNNARLDLLHICTDEGLEWK
jgi:hypothetical protein